MNLPFSSLLITFGCVFLASCYPYDESKGKKPTKKQAQTTSSQAAPKKSQATAAAEKKKEAATKTTKEAEKKKEAATKPTKTPANTAGTPPKTGTTPTRSPQNATSPSENESATTPPPPAPTKRPEYKYATKAPGKEGYVLSPYNNKMIEVKGIPSGTLVQDPTYTGAGNGYFRVP